MIFCQNFQFVQNGTKQGFSTLYKQDINRLLTSYQQLKNYIVLIINALQNLLLKLVRWEPLAVQGLRKFLTFLSQNWAKSGKSCVNPSLFYHKSLTLMYQIPHFFSKFCLFNLLYFNLLQRSKFFRYF